MIPDDECSVSQEWGNSDRYQIPVWGALAMAMGLLVGVRLLPVFAVFRGSDVVLLGNDAYGYLHAIPVLIEKGYVPGANTHAFGMGEPFLVWILSLIIRLVGGAQYSEIVLALYPVIAGTISGLLIFTLSILVARDIRVGLVAVVFLAVTPLHVSRTAIGFADHHAFDLLLVALIATTITWLFVRVEAPARLRWGIASLLGIGIGAQTMAWIASPLFLIPAGLAIGGYSIIGFRSRDPAQDLLPVVFGLGVGAVMAQLMFHYFGWLDNVVAMSPVLLLAAAIIILGLTKGMKGIGGTWSMLFVAEVSALAIGILFLWEAAPGFVFDVMTRVGEFSDYLGHHQTSGIGETDPLTQQYGPIVGFSVLLGFAPFLGLPTLSWVLIKGWKRMRPAWVVPSVFAVWFLALAFIQRRWAVHLAPFLAVFAGVGFVKLAQWLELVSAQKPDLEKNRVADREPIRVPERERIAILGVMGLTGTGISVLSAREILSRVTVDEPVYQAAKWISEFAARRNLVYPENYVLAHWGRVRVYNHFVNGNSLRYNYARDTYEPFLSSYNPDDWFEDFQGRVGFVVTQDVDDASPAQTQTRLHENLGSAVDSVDGVAHYRALWRADEGEVTVFSVVPGATIEGKGLSEPSVELSTTVSLAPNDSSFTYTRRVGSDREGNFSVRVAHPGTYRVQDQEINVPVRAIRNGDTIQVNLAD